MPNDPTTASECGSWEQAPIRPAPHDVQVHLAPSDGVRPQFFGTVVGISATYHIEGRRTVTIQFDEGGVIEIVDPTLLWIEPDRH